MTRDVLRAETILTTTEDVLRRHGLAKATVLDVARALGVSHGSVYRHFPSKAALREAVTRRWLGRARAVLATIAAGHDPAPERLNRWLTAAFEGKRAKALDDPELFETYRALAVEHTGVTEEHVTELLAQLRAVVEAGIASGDFAPTPPDVAARAVFDAVARFQHPLFAAEWAAPGVQAEFDAVRALVVRGLLAR
ncbi:TetR family transcriptional regulator [Umezawaea sp. Da 62-37]|uniref:TetR family transcriptional regulator n=1 Tax=Umezawaea sp. Da 62-37 TaxID=3075927 RepID=UPI0028F73BEC|nr:TetR family transcriptional regulator [Umezawaea sp. Da 62-37]WNV85930.1 TetR family transcriptional regulator [Umezawaea sp. Da 62-37]